MIAANGREGDRSISLGPISSIIEELYIAKPWYREKASVNPQKSHVGRSAHCRLTVLISMLRYEYAERDWLHLQAAVLKDRTLDE
jgi:hypothetical protein